MFFKRKKYIFVIEPEKKRKSPLSSSRFKTKHIIFTVIGFIIIIGSIEYEKNKLKRRQAAVDILRLEEMVEQFIWENGRCPGSVDEIVEQKSKEISSSQYIFDPWGKKYEIICPGKKNQSGFDIISAGPDKSLFTRDDISIH